MKQVTLIFISLGLFGQCILGSQVPQKPRSVQAFCDLTPIEQWKRVFQQFREACQFQERKEWYELYQQAYVECCVIVWRANHQAIPVYNPALHGEYNHDQPVTDRVLIRRYNRLDDLKELGGDEYELQSRNIDDL